MNFKKLGKGILFISFLMGMATLFLYGSSEEKDRYYASEHSRLAGFAATTGSASAWDELHSVRAMREAAKKQVLYALFASVSVFVIGALIVFSAKDEQATDAIQSEPRRE